MKKLVALLLCSALLLSACGGAGLGNSESKNSEMNTEQHSENTESESSSNTDVNSEMESETTTESETESDTESVIETESETEKDTEKEPEKDPEKVPEKEPEKESEKESESEEESEEETEELVGIEKPYDVPKVLIYTNGEEIIKDAYISCNIVIVDEQGGSHKTIRDAESSIKIRGNSTSGADKKPFNIKFSGKTDVLGMGANKKWSLLANCFDKTLLRNQTAFDLAKKLGIPFTPDYRVVDVYVDDVLQGSYLFVDSIEVSPTRVDIDTSNNEFLIELDYNPEDEECQYFYSSRYGIKFAINEPEKKDLTSEQYNYVTNLIKNAEAALASKNMKEIEKYFDIDSMASFYLLLEFFRNVDVNTSSTRFHIKDGKIYGGPVWDFDLSAGNYQRSYYTSMYDRRGNCYAGLYATNMPWFGALTKVSEFQDVVNQKFLDNQKVFVNLYADNSLGQNYIDKMINTYRGSIDRNHEEAGWDPSKIHTDGFVGERTPDATYEANVEYYRNWLKQRNEWLLKEWDLD